jgi:hypothetical protein
MAVELARHHLEHLGLAQAAAVLESRLGAPAQKQMPYADFLADLLGAEAAARRERYLLTRARDQRVGELSQDRRPPTRAGRRARG